MLFIQNITELYKNTLISQFGENGPVAEPDADEAYDKCDRDNPEGDNFLFEQANASCKARVDASRLEEATEKEENNVDIDAAYEERPAYGSYEAYEAEAWDGAAMTREEFDSRSDNSDNGVDMSTVYPIPRNRDEDSVTTSPGNEADWTGDDPYGTGDDYRGM